MPFACASGGSQCPAYTLRLLCTFGVLVVSLSFLSTYLPPVLLFLYSFNSVFVSETLKFRQAHLVQYNNQYLRKATSVSSRRRNLRSSPRWSCQWHGLQLATGDQHTWTTSIEIAHHLFRKHQAFVQQAAVYRSTQQRRRWSSEQFSQRPELYLQHSKKIDPIPCPSDR